MNKILDHKKYIENERGASMLEMAILFPVLMAMLMAVYDLGQGIVVNQKTIAASQIIGDLITRNEVVNLQIIDDVIDAGELALQPYSTDEFGYDIASVVFDEELEPEVLWRATDNMIASDAALNTTIGLGEEGEGVVVVSVKYAYIPLFSSFVVDRFDMVERSFLRGRKSLTVPCSDCD